MSTVRNPLFDNLWMSLANEADKAKGQRHFTPPADIRETESGYRLELDVPGLTEKQLEMMVEGRHLTIKGERQPADGNGVTRRERSFGAFERLFHLPEDADAGRIDAKVAQGVLTIDILKRENSRARPISIQVG